MNYRLVVYLLGILTLILAGIMSICLPWAWLDGDNSSLAAFLLSMGIAGATGGMLMLTCRGSRGEILGQREGLLVVTGSWCMAGLVGALPFMLSGTIPHFADALFESISGFTTTGASVLSNIEVVPRAVLFWRSLIQWLGGMGIVVLFVAVLPGLGMGGRFLYGQEAPGPSKAGLRPHVRDTASLLWRIYLGLSAVEVMALYVAGLDIFESLCHTFTTMATGGYSTRNLSVAGFESLRVEIVIIVFMLAAGTNFGLFASLWRGGLGWRGRQGIRRVFQDPEFKLYLGFFIAATLIAAFTLVGRSGLSPGEALRQASFQAASMQTTTGFATADFDAWPSLARLIMVGLMFVGGSAGSTGGSIKVVRFLILGKMAWTQVRRFFRPRRINIVRIGDDPVDEDMLNAVAGFFILFLATWALLSLALAALGQDLVTAATASIACLGNIGPGLAGVGPTHNFMWMGDAEKILLSVSMIVGRLELYTVLGLLSRSFWRV